MPYPCISVVIDAAPPGPLSTQNPGRAAATGTGDGCGARSANGGSWPVTGNNRGRGNFAPARAEPAGRHQVESPRPPGRGWRPDAVVVGGLVVDVRLVSQSTWAQEGGAGPGDPA